MKHRVGDLLLLMKHRVGDLLLLPNTYFLVEIYEHKEEHEGYLYQYWDDVHNDYIAGFLTELQVDKGKKALEDYLNNVDKQG